MNLNQITITVSDIEQSILFYEKLGLRLIVKAPHYSRFECPDGDATFSVHLGEVNLSKSVQIYFEVDNVDQTINELALKGVKIMEEKISQTWLWDEAKIADPDGHIIIIYHAGENRKNPPWRIG